MFVYFCVFLVITVAVALVSLFFDVLADDEIGGKVFLAIGLGVCLTFLLYQRGLI
jgi:hypothetical protein